MEEEHRCPFEHISSQAGTLMEPPINVSQLDGFHTGKCSLLFSTDENATNGVHRCLRLESSVLSILNLRYEN